MDQVRVALAWLKEQHFWVLSVLASLTAVACWYMAAGALSEAFKKNQSAIKSEFSAQQGLNSQPYHPNDKVNKQQKDQIEALATKVEAVWSSLYQEQLDSVLKWPEQLDDNASRSSDKFLVHIKDKRFGQFISDRFRERYLNYIKKRFSDLPEIIQAQEISEQGAGGGGRMPMFGADGEGGGALDSVEDQDYLVRWEDQMVLKSQLAWSSIPSSLQIWVTQEDLWVYETLLRAIAATNDAAGADRYSNAAVRTIYQMQVGATASTGSRTESRIFRGGDESAGGLRGGVGEGGGGLDFGGDFPGAGGGGGDFPGAAGPGFSMDGTRGGGGLGLGGGGGDDAQSLLANRYVNEKGEPQPAPAGITPGEPLQLGAAEYKRLPIRLVLEMDQRWLHQLIVELANAPLQVEVDEVRINPPEAGASGVNLRSNRLRALELAGRGGQGQDQGVEAFPREPHVLNVIIKGTVFIFNPPDPSVLSVGDDADLTASAF